MNKMTGKRCIIVYSLRWPETCAIKGLYALISPDIQIITCFTPETLAELLSKYTTASVILGILPHESIFLLSRLGPYLQQHHILFFGQRFNYVDKTLPIYFLNGNAKFLAWKEKTILQISKNLSEFLTDQNYHGSTDCYISMPSERPCDRELIYHVNHYLYQMFSHYGVGERSGKVLLMLSYGLSTEKISRVLGICSKTISVYKYNGLSRLGMSTGSYNIHRGIFVRAILQQYGS